ncbi:MAG: hypothetical protein B6D64_13455 [Bacteroidetes bacterium 4484_276]|nr:MAG: hypothetical protein B6D64_13455 [Bacteroidetes bacterium 4484_276]
MTLQNYKINYAVEWKNGKMEWWKDGRLEEWNIGVLEYWRIGVMEEWSVFLIDYESGMKSCQTVILYIAHRT